MERVRAWFAGPWDMDIDVLVRPLGQTAMTWRGLALAALALASRRGTSRPLDICEECPSGTRRVVPQYSHYPQNTGIDLEPALTWKEDRPARMGRQSPP